jgi:hypothetical protein
MNDGGKTVQTTQNSEPWSEQKPFLQEGFNRALFQLNSDSPEYYPGQTVTDTAAATTAGQNAMMDGAAASNTLRNATVDGQFLSSGNPYFQGMVNQIGQAIRPSIDSAFASSGRLGSGAHANAFSSTLADQAGRLAYQNYGDERTRQMAAGQDYSPYQAFMQVGQQQEAKQGDYLKDAAARWDFEQNKDPNKLAQYMNLVGNRSYGEQRVGTQPMTGNSTMAGIGTGLAGLGALGQFATGMKGLFG